MPKIAEEWGPLDVKRAQHPGGSPNPVQIAVGGVSGLHIQITPNGAKSWVLRSVIAGKRRRVGLGSYPTVSLAQARERAREAHDQIWRGVDPVAERKAAQAALRRSLTFSEALEKALESRLAEFRSEKHKGQWRSTLDTYASPVIGALPVDQIAVQDVLRVLEPIWSEKTETASRLRGRIEAVLSWATVAGHRAGDNPARWKGNLDAILPKPSRVAKVTHHAALSVAEAPDWMADLRKRDGIATRALEFVALTAARSGEVRGATWAEIDLEAGLWIVPADRMKAKREHRVPLTPEAVDLLRSLPRMQGSPYVFPSARGGQLSDMSLSACMKRISEAKPGAYLDPRSGRPAVPHGLRSTFRDWAAERGVDRDLAEISLAHVVGSEVERAYRRSDMVERRRQLMASWAAYLAGDEGAKVVPLKAR